jgi:hypothetical protein
MPKEEATTSLTKVAQTSSKNNLLRLARKRILLLKIDLSMKKIP